MMLYVMLLLQIAVARGDYRAADLSLEQALSCDFKVRTSPLYHLIKSQVRLILKSDIPTVTLIHTR
jgi:hypothetical protein